MVPCRRVVFLLVCGIRCGLRWDGVDDLNDAFSFSPAEFLDYELSESLTNGAVGTSAKRTDAGEIAAYMDSLIP
jgi:hypothetical protein